MPEDLDISDLLEPPGKTTGQKVASKLGAFAEGAADTASGGYVDEGTGLAAAGIEAGAALHKVGVGGTVGGLSALASWVRNKFLGSEEDFPLRDPREVYREARASKREDQAQLQAEEGSAYKAGQVAGAVASTVVTPMAAGRAGRAAQVLAEGGARGLGSSEADLTQGEVIDAAKDFARGAAIAAPAAALGALAPRGTSAASKPVRDPAAEARAALAGTGKYPGAVAPKAAAAAKAPSALADAAAGAAVGYAADEVLKRFGKDTGIPLPLIAAALAVARSKAGGKLGGSTYQQFAGMARGKITPEMVRTMAQTMPEAATRAFYDELGRAAEPAVGPITKKPGADTDVDISDLL